jgi:hypothetical protein
LEDPFHLLRFLKLFKTVLNTWSLNLVFTIVEPVPPNHVGVGAEGGAAGGGIGVALVIVLSDPRGLNKGLVPSPDDLEACIWVGEAKTD